MRNLFAVAPLIENRYQAVSIEDKVEMATEEEKAIYKASKLLEEKLNVIKLLQNPALINRKEECRSFKFFSLVLKYRRIYSSHFQNKGIDVDVTGISNLEITAHPIAVSVIPHTFIDNALKYSPKNGKIVISIQDRNDYIDFSVASFGPRIGDDEKEQIFLPFYRGRAAQAQEEEGAGYGLYVSQLVAKEHLGTEITYSQQKNQVPRMGHWTVFSVRIPVKAKILF